MKTIIVADRRREQMALKLWAQVGGEILWDNDQHGAAWNHHRALQKVAAEGQAIIIEDDAVLTDNFIQKAQSWIEKHPGRVISFYLGTGRPKSAQAMIQQALADNHEMVELPTLLHGVCYTLTQEQAQTVLRHLNPESCIDVNIGSVLGEKVIYPVPSLADHADTTPVETHPDGEARTESRRAYLFE